MFPFISHFVTKKDCRDVARMHSDGERTVGRIEALVNEGHRQRVGHDYVPDDRSDDCATCARDNDISKSVELAEERLRRCARGSCESADCRFDPETRTVKCVVCGRGESLCMHSDKSWCTSCRPETALPRAKSVQIRHV